MDNIQKLLLGVLSIAGVIAMLTPTDIDFASQTPNASPAEGIPVAPPPTVESVEEEAALPEDSEEQPEEEDEEDFLIGEPLIDGNPVGVTQNQQNPANSWAQPAQASPNYSYNYGQSSAPSYGIGGTGMPSATAQPEAAAPVMDVGQ
ncbi:MAG: hypothetical protein IBJ12_11055 [Sphingomonadaceae bacterium]|nr:hypothetical protein [Sphingomonadaceae bacterium]